MNKVEYIENKGKWRASVLIKDDLVMKIQYRGLWNTKEEAQKAPPPMLWKRERDKNS